MTYTTSFQNQCQGTSDEGLIHQEEVTLVFTTGRNRLVHPALIRNDRSSDYQAAAFAIIRACIHPFARARDSRYTRMPIGLPIATVTRSAFVCWDP